MCVLLKGKLPVSMLQFLNQRAFPVKHRYSGIIIDNNHSDNVIIKILPKKGFSIHLILEIQSKREGNKRSNGLNREVLSQME